ncbi:hypothetical protein NDU88_002090 [Pleurodeles waltl]|uniref:SAP domain-containing protein n=1 Tax=Pleurodeles waltl TaxID=8319 RepID=A0AAV7VA79_PLEWA|nr:hypothetical protein NDU88_002090 [Pleurodeles waltl]
MEMDLINVHSLNKAELQTVCKERELKVGTKATKVDLHTVLQTYEEVKRPQTATEEDDRGGDLVLDEEEDQGFLENQGLQEEHPCTQKENQDTLEGAGTSVSSRGP